jgi:predicted ATP-dependent endonuclease of OLD family
MRINSIEIHNWRSIENIKINFENLMIFIGQNNHGKSNVLSAILFFLGEFGVSETDYRKGTDELWVEIEFTDLDSHDKNQFKKYVTSDNKVKVRRSANSNTGVSYNGYTQIPKDDLLKETALSDYTSRDKAKELPFYDLLPDSGRITKAQLQEALGKYISENADSIEFEYNLEETNFLGAKNIAQGIFGTVIFVPALKNASDELSTKGSSTFNKLLSKVINEMSESNEKYKEAREKIKELTQILNKQTADGNDNTERPAELSDLESQIENLLSRWNTTIDIEITPPNIDDVFRLGTQVWVDDGVKTDIAQKGHGLQRSMLFALIRSWIVTSKEAKKVEAEDADSGRKTSDSTYFILEEPELYLHPQAQREFFQTLKDISEQEKGQVIMSTHSSYFLDLDMYRSICIIKKENSGSNTDCFQCTTDLFSAIDDKKHFNLSYWINPDRGELFFSEKTILVEGPSDKTIIPYLAKSIEVFKHGYTIIDCGGKSSIPLYIHLLNSFKIPYVAVYDKDHQSNKNDSDKNKADADSKRIEDSVDSSLGSTVILENDIEEEIGITDGNKKNKPFIALTEVSNENYSLTDSFKEKIKLIYK